MLAARWTLGIVAALSAQVALASQGVADGGVTDDSLAPLIEEGGTSQPTPPAGSPTQPAGSPRATPAPSPDQVDEVLVQLPTRTPESLEWAPAIVTVLTREDLLALGYRTLGEVLRNATGFEINDDGAWPDTGARGLNATGTHGGLLRLMVDGHDMAWRQLGWNLYDRSWVDLDDVDRIEIVRGPTGGVWGSNAVAGAVNVVTRDWRHLRGGAEATYGVTGALDGQFASARVGGVVGDVSLYGSFAYSSDSADPALAPLREPLLVSSTSATEIYVTGARQDAAVANLKARWRDLQLQLWHGRSEIGAPLFPLSVVGGDDTRLITDRSVARLSWSRELLPGLDARAELALDQIAFDRATVYENQPLNATPGDPAAGQTGHFLRKMFAFDRRTELHAQASYGFGEGLRAAGGLDVEWLIGVRRHFPEVFAALVPPLSEPRLSTLHLGAWAEVLSRPFSMLELSAAARYDFDPLYGSALTPQAAAVLHLPADVYVKGIYGSGFRAPSVEELQSFQKDATYGNPELGPESSLTGELEIGYAPGSLRVSVAGFITRLNGLIVPGERGGMTGLTLLSPDDFPASQHPTMGATFYQLQNGGFVTTLGAEVDVRFEPVPALALQFQGSLRRPRDETDQRLYYTPEWIAGGSATWRLTRTLTASLRMLAVGDRLVPQVGLNEPGFPSSWADVDDPTPSAPPAFVATGVIRAMLSDRVALELKLDNVTGAWWWDAGPVVLYPQRRFQATAWISASL